MLCATPIGNLDDMSPRAARVIGEADVLACEDTRRTRKLLLHFGLRAPELVVYNEGNERRRTPELARRCAEGATVVLVTDAGMPGLSDPGYRLVRACVDRAVAVEVVPGPSASISALAVSGLPSRRFVFEGFLPRKAGERRRRIAELAAERRTVVLYVSPHKVAESLEDLVEELGDRPAALARELTKLHEEVRRGTLPELLAGVHAEPPRGEIVLVIGGAGRADPEVASEELARRALELMSNGVERRTALSQVARATGVPRRMVFDALVEAGARGAPTGPPEPRS
ncbi:MAG: 16S rRNA (cytidine(1402)-2'-O)-methyltransferase [Actinomycetota bacterium]